MSIRKGTRSKKAKFKRLANKRVNAVLDNFRLIENLSNKYNYQYNNEQIDKIFQAIQDKINNTKAKFQEKQNPKFKI
jgi:hypothetical protein